MFSMLHGKRLMVVMPAFRAAKTIETTWRELPYDIIARVLLVDDASSINFKRLVQSCPGVPTTPLMGLLKRTGLYGSPLFAVPEPVARPEGFCGTCALLRHHHIS
jgi:hypothetical protein